MRAHRFSALALAVVLLALAGSIPAGAQTRPMSFADSLAFQRVDRKVASHSRLRILGETSSFEARGSDVILQGIRTVAPAEAGGAPTGLVPWSEIQRVQVRGNEAGRGALIGATTAALLGGALIVIASSIEIGFGDSDDPTPTEITAYTLGFAAAGGIVGGTFGAMIPRWKTVHTWAGF